MAQVTEVYNNLTATSLIVELWAAGASGGRGAAVFNGQGGGGGQYQRKTLAATPATPYNVRWGVGGISMTGAGETGGNTDVPMGTQAEAIGGSPVTGGTGGSGDVTRDGGDGGSPNEGNFVAGLSGGASGSRDGVGGDAADTPGGAPGTPVSTDGGGGGQGGPVETPGSFGDEPGGGGGGGGASNTVDRLGGDGGDGVIVIWEDLGVWPPVGQTPLAGFGTAYVADPDRFTAIAGNGNPKLRKGAFIL